MFLVVVFTLTDCGEERVGELVFVFGWWVRDAATQTQFVLERELLDGLDLLQRTILPVSLQHTLHMEIHHHIWERRREFIIWNMVLHYQIPRLPGRSCHLFLVLIRHQNVITFSTSKKPGRNQSSLVIFQFMIDKSHITFSLLNILFHFEKHHILKVKSVQAGFKTSMGFFFLNTIFIDGPETAIRGQVIMRKKGEMGLGFRHKHLHLTTCHPNWFKMHLRNAL